MGNRTSHPSKELPRLNSVDLNAETKEEEGSTFDQEVESAMASTEASSPAQIQMSKERVEDYYALESTRLGRGHYATVYRGRSRRTNTPVAIKKIRRALTDETRLKSEVEALRKIQQHPNIVTLLDVFETPGDVYVVMELCTGGELFERLAEKGPYSEMDCVRHVKSMASAVAYMHANDIVHRDLKPENILLSTPDDSLACIKIADFGLAKIASSMNMKTKCGTWGYSAPEMISGSGTAFGYDAKVDSWSLGTIIYILLCGFHPFDPNGTRSDNEMIDAIKKCQFDFNDEAWSGISAQAKDLITHLLVLDPTERYSMQDLLNHPWITGKEGVDIPVQPLSPTIHTDLARYHKASRQKVLSKLVARFRPNLCFDRAQINSQMTESIASSVSLKPPSQTEFRRSSTRSRISILIHSHYTNLRMQHSLASPLIRVPILFLLVVMNGISMLYLGLWGTFFLFGDPLRTTVLQVVAAVPSGFIYYCMALLHIADIWIILFKSRLVHLAKSASKTGIMASRYLQYANSIRHKKLRSLIVFATSNELGRIGQHLFMVVILSAHAQHVCDIIVDTSISTAYMVVVALYCVCTPLCMCSSKPFIKRYMTLLVDTAFHFLLSTGLSFVIFAPQIMDYFELLPQVWIHSETRLVSQIPMDWSLISTSYDSLLFFLFIFMINHLTLHYLTHLAISATTHKIQWSAKANSNGSGSSKRMISPLINAKTRRLPSFKQKENQVAPEPVHAPGPLTLQSIVEQNSTDSFKHVGECRKSVKTSTFTSHPVKTLSQSASLSRLSIMSHPYMRRLSAKSFLMLKERRKIHLEIYFILNILWAFVLLGAVFDSLAPISCPPGCLASTHPWFEGGNCHCTHFQVNCKKLNITSDAEVDAIIAKLDGDLLVLHIVYCDLRNGLSPDAIKDLTSLFMLRIEFTNLTTWDYDNVLPRSLQVLELRYTQLQTLPRALWTLPPSLASLTIDHSSISYLPTNLTWPQLIDLRMTYSQLIEVPQLTAFTQLAHLNLKYNNISALPSSLPSSLNYLDVSGNHLSSLPPAVTSAFLAKPFQMLLASNPISTLDKALIVHTVLDDWIDIAETPVCNSIYNLLPPSQQRRMCYTPCTPRCPKAALGDFLPDKECYNAACAFDLGDFTNVLR